MRTLRELIPKKHLSSFREKSVLIDEKTIFYVCRKILIEEYGTRGGENIIPTFFKDKKLFLTPHSSLWGNEVWLQRKSLAERMNEALGSDVIAEIKLTQER